MQWMFFAFISFTFFFFLRAYYLLAKIIGKSIKAKDVLLNIAVLTTGLSAFVFIIHLFFSTVSSYIGVLYNSRIKKNMGNIKMLYEGISDYLALIMQFLSNNRFNLTNAFVKISARIMAQKLHQFTFAD